MERTRENIAILKSFLMDTGELPHAEYVKQFHAFYVNIKRSGMLIPIYITWDKVVEAYTQYVNNLLNIK